MFLINIEYLSILGLYAGPKTLTISGYDSKVHFGSTALIIKFLGVSFMSIYQNILEGNYMKSRQRMISILMQKLLHNALSEGANLIVSFSSRYAIWIFHSFVNLLIFLDPKKDLINGVICLLECSLLPIHFYYWTRYSGKKLYTKIFNSWRVLYFTINIQFFWRYIAFFVRYSFIKNLVESYLKKLKNF